MAPMQLAQPEWVWPISMGLAIGPLACSSSDAARPSQNCSRLNARLMTVGALRPPSWPRTPRENRCPSVNAARGSWQLAHDTVASPDNRLSKYSSQPSSAFSGVYLLSFGQMIGGSPSGTAGPSLGNASAGSAAENRYANAPMQTMA